VHELNKHRKIKSVPLRTCVDEQDETLGRHLGEDPLQDIGSPSLGKHSEHLL
jgi:hypothetical protein